jgi:hypothetical protein
MKVKFNMINMAKPDSLYNYGMKILCFSKNVKKEQGLGWHRVGDNISYFANSYKRDPCGLVRYSRNFYTFTFTRTFESEGDD